jgi:hypothetical protein
VWEWIAGSDEWTYFSDNLDFVDETELAAALSAKQDTLVSGTNIKTINSESLLGEGNIDVGGTPPDDVTIEINTDDKLAVKDGGVSTAKIADGAVTAAKIAAGTVGPSPYTYVVDSNAALAAWANNTAGHDYTSVLIKPGTWTSSVEVNLTTSGTKVVTGMPGSALSFTSAYGLRYQSVPTTTDYRMDGVTITGSASHGFHSCTNLTNCTSTANTYSFHSCTNLTNCKGTVTGTSNSYGFYSCTNLDNCTSTSNSMNSNYTYGFYSCNNLDNCTSTATGTSNSYGFYYCNNLDNCTGTSNSYDFHSCNNLDNCTGTATGFYNCNNLTNCTGTATGTGFYNCTNLTNCTSTANTYGFHSCNNLTNCTGTGTGSSYTYGFHSCNNLTNCTGAGTGTSNSYGFYYCKGMLLNKPGSSSTTQTYSNCYVSVSGSGAAPSDTAAGGWNKV